MEFIERCKDAELHLSGLYEVTGVTVPYSHWKEAEAEFNGMAGQTKMPGDGCDAIMWAGQAASHVLLIGKNNGKFQDLGSCVDTQVIKMFETFLTGVGSFHGAYVYHARDCTGFPYTVPERNITLSAAILQQSTELLAGTDERKLQDACKFLRKSALPLGVMLFDANVPLTEYASMTGLEAIRYLENIHFGRKNRN